MKLVRAIMNVCLSLLLVGLFSLSAEGTQAESKLLKPSKQTDQKVVIGENGKQIDIKIGDELFTTFDYGRYAKPIFYPILGPGQIGMTRNWPMKEGVAGEAHDHPHHKSMWISHEIDGVDFWSENGGSVKVQTVKQLPGESNAFQANSKWVGKDGKTILSDTTLYRFGSDRTSRWIDCEITFQASDGDFEFEDSKEGTFAIRTHPDLRLDADPKNGVEKVFGQAINSEGVRGKAIWGKPAKWLLYYGEIDGVPMSITMFDHPGNLRHPTTWHARAYGLVTANPFGMYHFLGKEKGSGSYSVKDGESLTLRYRVDFIKGEATVDEVNARYREYCR